MCAHAKLAKIVYKLDGNVNGTESQGLSKVKGKIKPMCIHQPSCVQKMITQT